MPGAERPTAVQQGFQSLPRFCARTRRKKAAGERVDPAGIVLHRTTVREFLRGALGQWRGGRVRAQRRSRGGAAAESARAA